MSAKPTYGSIAARIGTELVPRMSEDTMEALVERWRITNVDPVQVNAVVNKVALDGKRGQKALEAIHDGVQRVLNQAKEIQVRGSSKPAPGSRRWCEKAGRELSDEEIAQEYEAMADEFPKFAGMLRRRARKVREKGVDALYGATNSQDVLALGKLTK